MRLFRSVMMACLLLGPLCRNAHGDGGTVRTSVTSGDCRITVFTSPTPFRAGPVDISVFVQDAATGKPITSADVSIHLAKIGSRPLEFPATTEAATNKLFHAAQFDLPEAGRWDMNVRIHGPHGSAEVRCELVAAEPMPRWLELVPWIGWPAAAIAVFGIHQVMVRRRETRQVLR
jgi:hypothetical protein